MSQSRGAVSRQVLDLLNDLRVRGVELRVDGDKLQVVAPRGSVGPELQAAIRAAKQQLITAIGGTAGAIDNSSEDRLAPVQERVWLYQELEPDSPTYNHTLVVRIEGPLELERLETALRRVIERHEPLRTSVGDAGAGPRRLTMEHADLALVVHDIAGTHARQAAAQSLIREQQAVPFDLRNGAPIRASLIRYAADEHDLVVTIHHIGIDGVSISRLYGEITLHYRGVELPRLKSSYRDYVADERAYWQPSRIEERLRFWRTYLDGAPRVLDLPIDFPASERMGAGAALLTTILPEAVLDSVQELARGERTSLFVVLLAAYGAALHRATGQRDILIGTPLHGRHRAEYSPLIGMFVNQAPLRVRVPAGVTLRELVRMTRDSALSAMEDREIPFGMLIDRLGVKRDAQRTPLFQTMLNVLPAVKVEPEADGKVTFKLPPTEELLVALDGQAKFDATVYAYEHDRELQLAMTYNSSRYAYDRMNALLEDMQRILAHGLSAPDTSLAEVMALPAVTSASETSDMSVGQATVVDRVLEIALTAPSSVALQDGTARISYRELVDRAAGIASLVNSEVRGDHSDPVGVLVPHGVEAGAALLGVLASGHAYVPLDPAYPTERLRYMVEDAGLGLLLTTDSHREQANALASDQLRVASIDDVPAVPAASSIRAQSNTIAYLLYTSGSTGRPKAVMQSHGNLLAQAERYADALGIDSTDRLALLASISFDASLMDLWGGLIRGASVYFIDPRAADLSQLAEYARDAELSTLHVTPTVFGTLARVTGAASWPSVRAVVLGGEPVRASHVEYFDGAFPADAILYNLYGASEHSFSFGHVVDRTSRSAEVPIGMPVGDVEALLLKEDGSEDPVRGELAIRSAHTALGYWNRSSASERAFIADPLDPERVLYRTGDIARRRTDGRFVALGRVDNQIKVRGHRIEPAEVEDVLRRHPSIQDVGVHAPVRDQGDDRALIACYVRRSNEDCDATGLKRWCEDRLPTYLVPSVWVEIDTLPRTPSGKIDRRALPMEAAGGVEAAMLREPRTATEHQVLAVWQSVLSRTEIGIADDFFSVGGHSLAAVEVVARLRDMLQTDIPLRVIFEHPTVFEIAEWVETHSDGTLASGSIRRLEGNDVAPLSFAQERVWLFQKLEPDSATYNVTPIIRLSGPVDRERLTNALRQLLDRHEALRSTLVEGEAGPEQRVRAVPAEVMAFHDIRGLPTADREAERQRLVRSQHGRAFDLGIEIPFRALLLTVDEDISDLVLTFHHVASDYTSVRTFMRELHTLYAGGVLPALPVRYRDYTAWERARWDEAKLGEEAQFWSQYLDGAPSVLEFPTDRPRTASTGYLGEFIEIRIPGPAAAPLLELARQERVSVFPLLLAVFGAVLHRHTGERDIVIGAPATGRSRSELQGVVGMFINQIPVRLQVAPERTLRELVRDARTSALAALTHQDMPFPRLVELLGGSRETGRTPLFQMMLNVLPAGLDTPLPPVDGVEFVQPELREFRSLIDLHSKYDFTLYAMQREGGLHLGLVYNRDLFDHGRMECVARDVERLLLDGAARPDRDLDELWRAPAERGAVPTRAFATMPEAFRHIARARASDVAIDEAGRQITWQGLLDAVEQTARLLVVKQGTTSTAPVGILTTHGSRAIISMLGALTAGRPYVPLDPTYPEDRLRFMIQDAGISIALATQDHAALADRLMDGNGRVLVLGSTPAQDATLPEPPRPDEVAYLLYTSGSTGRPKAVMQTHGNLLEQAARYADAIGLSAADRLAWMASVSFDASVMDVYGGLLGGAVIVPVEARSTDLSQLAELVADRQVSVLHLTPTVLRSVGRVTPNAAFSTVRMLVLGGEPVRPEHVEFFDGHFAADATLYNLYGASEHSFSFGGTVPRTLRSVEIPIGRPVGDVEPILVSADGRSDSVIGELVIRSRHNASGYWNAREMSDRVFNVDPNESTLTLYRTGDIVRRRPDGQLVFVRRADSRMKVRGHRIEAYEVETALKGHALVADAAVHAPTGDDGESVLTACVVAKAGAQPHLQELADWCRTFLPSFMVPTSWTFLAELPRTPSGKVDRRALPAGDTDRATGAGHLGARDAEEHELLGIWQDVLGLQQISVTDDFFVLGGHSLNATEIVARVRDVIGVEIPLRYFFDHPTIAEAAAWIREHRSSVPILPPLLPGSTNGDSPLSFSQERLWFLQQLDRNATAYNMATAGLIAGPFDVERFRSAVDAVAMRQEALRTTIRAANGRPVQVVSPVPAHHFEFADISADAPADGVSQALDRIRRVTSQPYDFEAGPLFRVIVVRVRADQHVIAFGSHHTVSDMWSYAVLGREIRDAYAGNSPPPLPVAYRDYAAWQRQWLQGDVLQEQVEFWRRQLTDCPKLELPTDYPRPAFFSFAGAVLDVELPKHVRDGIQRLAVRHHVTPFMALLAAYNVLLATYSGQDDIAVGVPIAGRRAAATEALVGTFVNTLVHRNDLSGDPVFTELLQRVRATALSAYANQDAPFELLVKELEPPRDTSRAPFFQVLFNVANIRTGDLDLEGLDFEPLSVQREASQFDMSIHVGWNEIESSLRLTYSTSLYRRETAERFLAHYLEILDAVVFDPSVRLSALRVPARRDGVLFDEWNTTGRSRDDAPGLAHTLTAVASLHPHRTAVTAPNGSFTYAELLQYAQSITAELRKAGIGKGDRVAILMERSREMLGALLGILGSGAAYIPVDPAYPEARVRYVLEDSGARMIVSHRGLYSRLGLVTPLLDLDAWEAPAPSEFEQVAPDQPAYVIYTSGSTGNPKGVEVPHGAMNNFLHSMRERPGASESDVLLAVTTISFDIAVLELYLPLIVGARVVIASEDDALDGRRLAHLMDQEGVTLMQATPATWKLLIAGGWNGKADLRVLCGGEPLPRTLADEMLDRVAELWNMYGPTETTVWSTLDRVQRDDAITVGQPIANTTCYVLGDDMRMKPIGVPGELWIGGAGVANGYVNRPDLTEKAFVDSPFRSGERIYRTGDLVRWRHDGRLEHLGRLDNQVKVRGFRVELGEVETALLAHEHVKDAVVTAKDDRLVGYIVPEPGEAVFTSDLRRMVSDVLPPYMVPSVIMSLQALPLTPNGKVDRKALPEPDAAPHHSDDWRQPSDPTAQAVAEIWGELLELDRIGLDDRFFEIGGHSLLAMEVVARIEERLGVRPEPRSLFFMTLEELAESIRSGVKA